MFEKPKQVVQGDLLFTPVTLTRHDWDHAVPVRPDRLRLPDGRLVRVLAEGEATGHLHVVPAEADVRQSWGSRLLFVPEGMVLEVEHVATRPGDKTKTHAPLTLPPGLYEIDEQREASDQQVLSRRYFD